MRRANTVRIELIRSLVFRANPDDYPGGGGHIRRVLNALFGSGHRARPVISFGAMRRPDEFLDPSGRGPTRVPRVGDLLPAPWRPRFLIRGRWGSVRGVPVELASHHARRPGSSPSQTGVGGPTRTTIPKRPGPSCGASIAVREPAAKTSYAWRARGEWCWGHASTIGRRALGRNVDALAQPLRVQLLGHRQRRADGRPSLRRRP